MKRLYKLLIGQYVKLFENNRNTVIITVLSRLLSILSFHRFRYLKILNRPCSHKRIVVAEEADGHSVEPLEFDKSVNLVEKPIYPIGVSIFCSKTMVHSASSLILSERSLYQQDYHFEHSLARLKLNSSLIVGNTTTHALIKMSIHRDEIREGVFLGGYWYSNWYHWVVELLSKITVLKKSNMDMENIPFLVPLRVKNLRNHLQLLESILPSENIIFIEENKWTAVNRLIWIDSPVIFTPNFKGKRNEFSLKDFNFHFELMKTYRNSLMKIFKEVNSQESYRIFLARKNEVRGYNQDEIAGLAKKYGFKIIYPEELSVIEQVSYFKNASFIIGATGAAWTNIIFCSSKAKALIWLPDLARDVPTYSNLAYLSKIRLYHLYFDTDCDDWIEFKTKKDAFYLDPIQFESTLNRLFEN